MDLIKGEFITMKRLIKAENEFIYKLANGANYTIECSEEPYPIEEGLKVDSYFEFLDELVEAVKYDGGDLNFVEYFNRYDENIPEGSLKSITVEFNPSSYKLITTVVANQSLNDAALDKIKDYMIGQFSDGWGEGFEQKPITTYNDDWECEYEEYDEETGDIDIVNDTVFAKFYVYVSFYGNGITYNWIK